MQYKVELKPKAVKDLKKIDKPTAQRIVRGLQSLSDNLVGDIKKLTNFTPEYRLRVGTYRVLFEVEETDTLVIYRILHRKDAYR